MYRPLITLTVISRRRGRRAGVVGEGVVHVHGAPQAVEGEGLLIGHVHNSVSVAIACFFKGHLNFDAYVMQHISHLVSNFVMDCLFVLLELGNRCTCRCF